jgi:hypothetical protein
MNHAFITVKGSLPRPTAFGAMLREIVAERWGTAIKVETEEDRRWHIQATEGTEYVWLSLWYRNARKLEMRMSLGDLSGWIQTYIQHALAARLNGSCSEEGTKYREPGTPEKYTTFRKWFEENYGAWKYVNGDPAETQANYDRLTAKIPKELLGNPAP